MSFGSPPHPEPIFWEPEAPLFQEVGNPKSLVGGLGNANSAFKSRLAPRQSWQAPAPARAQNRPHESPNPSPRAPKTHPQRPTPNRPRRPSHVPGERVLVKSTLAEWHKPWPYGPPQNARGLNPWGCPSEPDILGEPDPPLSQPQPSPSPAPAQPQPLPQPRPQLRSTPPHQEIFKSKSTFPALPPDLPNTSPS